LDLASYVVSGMLSNRATSSATVAVDNHPIVPATTVSVKALPATVAAGKPARIQAAVTNQFGNSVGPGEEVSFLTSGGKLSAGTARTNASGLAVVSLRDAKAGAAAVTATIATAATSPNCTAPASAATGAVAGRCSADTVVRFVARRVERPSLAAAASGKGSVMLRATSRPRLAHAVVQFFRLAAGGKRISLGTARTESNGVAVKTVKLRGGPGARFAARVIHLSSQYVSEYSAAVSLQHRK
jgi:hypothetical protein